MIDSSKCNDKCLSCDTSGSIHYCYICKDDYDLFNGECIRYAFEATYNVTDSYYSYNRYRLYNQNNLSDLYAMKIDYSISSPSPEYTFYSYYDNKIYFYVKENSSISLEYLFKDITNLTEFSFNEKFINNLNITSMKGMFSGCSSLMKLFLIN